MEFLEAKGGKKVAVRYWEDVDAPRAAVVVVHGMCEYISRYDDFCRFLNTKGFYVMGMDNRSFGDTDPDAQGMGYAGMFEDTVDDIRFEVDQAKKRWNVQDVFVIGHSYGSFLTQRFIEKYHADIAGAVLVGSALQDGLVLWFGKTIANAKFKKHADEPGEIFADLTFRAYDKKLKDGQNGWLNRDKAAVEAYNADPRCGFTCSNGFYKSMFDGLKLTNAERGKVPSDFKLFIISGAADGVGGYGKLVKKLVAAYKKKCGLQPQYKLYDGARHEILNEINKAEVYGDVASFLDGCLADRR